MKLQVATFVLAIAPAAAFNSQSAQGNAFIASSKWGVRNTGVYCHFREYDMQCFGGPHRLCFGLLESPR
jgi:hypothetical protein